MDNAQRLSWIYSHSAWRKPGDKKEIALYQDKL